MIGWVKPEEIESYKFRAESLRQFGLILSTPLGIDILKFFQSEISLSEAFLKLKTFIAFILAILGFCQHPETLDNLFKCLNLFSYSFLNSFGVIDMAE